VTGNPARLETAADARAAERAAAAFQLVEGWFFSESMTELVAAFGGGPPSRSAPEPGSAPGWLHPSEELPQWLTPLLAGAPAQVRGLTQEQLGVLRGALALEQLVAADFDFRGSAEYRERAQAATADFDAELRDRVFDLTDRLGLVSPRPPRFDRYSGTLVLGGGYKSPLLRARYSATLRESGVELGELDFLGSPRFLIEEPAERPVVQDYAPGAVDEFDLMTAAACAEFDLAAAEVEFLCGCASADLLCPVWRYRDDEVAGHTEPAYTHERRVELAYRDGRAAGCVLSASTGRPPYRPDTADTFALWARCFDPRPGKRVLVVTTQVFVPFQAFEGLRRLHLPYGVEVDAVGFGAEWGDRPLTAEYLLQETLSAIRSGRRLLVDAAEVLINEA